MNEYSWFDDAGTVNLDELSNLYRIAPLGDKPPAALATVFGNSMFTCFAYADDLLAGPGGYWPMASIAPTSPMWPSTLTIKDAAWALRLSVAWWNAPAATRRSSCTPGPGPKPSTAIWDSCT